MKKGKKKGTTVPCCPEPEKRVEKKEEKEKKAIVLHELCCLKMEYFPVLRFRAGGKP